jgi:anaphase-promoting complex subunit 11
MKVKLVHAQLVANWTWNGVDEVCGICHMQLDGCSPEAMAKFLTPGDECPVVWGKCKHAFHLTCIAKWLGTQQPDQQTCPMCRRRWEYAD